MLEKKAVTATPIHELLERRWSPRAYDKTKPVSRAQVLALLEAARWAPSCNGDEPWRYLVWNRADDAAGWQKVFETLSENNKKWCANVPVLMLSCAGSVFGHSGKPNRHAQHDTGMASLNLSLQAVALGLVAHQMGGFDSEKIRAAFAIPADYTPMAMIAVGYQADPAVLPDDVKAKELAPRKRKPLGECFFAGSWDKPYAN
jgi:nitroreductase